MHICYFSGIFSVLNVIMSDGTLSIIRFTIHRLVVRLKQLFECYFYQFCRLWGSSRAGDISTGCAKATSCSCCCGCRSGKRGDRREQSGHGKAVNGYVAKHARIRWRQYCFAVGTFFYRGVPKNQHSVVCLPAWTQPRSIGCTTGRRSNGLLVYRLADLFRSVIVELDDVTWRDGAAGCWQAAVFFVDSTPTNDSQCSCSFVWCSDTADETIRYGERLIVAKVFICCPVRFAFSFHRLLSYRALFWRTDFQHMFCALRPVLIGPTEVMKLSDSERRFVRLLLQVQRLRDR